MLKVDNKIIKNVHGEYEKQAIDFLEKYNIKMYINSMNEKNEEWGGLKYKVLIKRNINGKNKQMVVIFTDSIHNMTIGEKPTAYDVLACLQKYDVGSFEDFCNEFGYEMYSETYRSYNTKNMKLYNAVCREFKNVDRIFGDIIEELAEIQ